jgi:hypothetical protein
VTGPAPGNDQGIPNFMVQTTPQNTLGRDDTFFGNLTTILKAAFYQDRDAGLTLSGGTGITIPTEQDTQVRVIDFGASPNNPFVSLQRLRDIVIHNDTMSLIPFVAGLYAPCDRMFTQGFVAVEVPIGSSRITYNNHLLRGAEMAAPGAPPTSLLPPFRVDRFINEQNLIHVDLSGGYWVYRDPDCGGLSGIAPSVELHYTGSLNNADTVLLPGDAAAQVLNPANPTMALPEPGPVVGGQPKQINIVDLTVGTTFTFGQRTMLAVAATVPLTNGVNRTFDWEFQVQLNYYFGCRGAPAAPPIQ